MLSSDGVGLRSERGQGVGQSIFRGISQVFEAKIVDTPHGKCSFSFSPSFLCYVCVALSGRTSLQLIQANK